MYDVGRQDRADSGEVDQKKGAGGASEHAGRAAKACTKASAQCAGRVRAAVTCRYMRYGGGVGGSRRDTSVVEVAAPRVVQLESTATCGNKAALEGTCCSSCGTEAIVKATSDRGTTRWQGNPTCCGTEARRPPSLWS
jgi:hypothetical protein